MPGSHQRRSLCALSKLVVDAYRLKKFFLLQNAMLPNCEMLIHVTKYGLVPLVMCQALKKYMQLSLETIKES